MTRTRIRWLESGLIVVAALGGIAALLSSVPGLVDVEAYKPGLIQAVREATGRELVIDGPMRLRMFPVPGVGAGTVRFANAVGAKGAQMIDVRWVAVRPSWSALLQGRVEVGTLTLYQPTIVLETDAKGIPNWEFGPGENARQAVGAPSGGFHLAIGRLQIVRGTITYTNPETKAVFKAENVNAGATVRSFEGPFEIDGDATVNGVPLKIEVAVGENTPAGHSARLNLKVSSGELDFKGGIATVQLDTKIQGHLSLKTGALSDFVTSVFSAIGQEKPAFDTSGAGRFSFEGDIDTSPDHLAATDFDMSMGKDAAKGSVKLMLGASPALNGKLALSRLDIGKWVQIFTRPVEAVPDPVKAVATAPTPEAAAAKAATAVVGPSPWSKIDADLSLQIAEAIYNGDTVRDLFAGFTMQKGVATVPQLRAALPGGMTIDVDAAKGTLKASAPHLRDTLRWLGVDTSGVPAGRLEKLAIDGKLVTKAGTLDMSDGTFKLDDVPGTMAGTLSLKVPVSAALNIGMEHFNLDDYVPKAQPADPAAPPPAVPKIIAKMPADLPKDAPSLGLKLDIRNLVYRGQTMTGVTGGATLTSDLMKLQNVRVANLLGAKLGLSGLVADYAAAPRFDLSFTVAAPDTDKLLDYVGLPKFMNGPIGPGTASGAVAGTREAVTLRDVAVHVLDTDARIAGTLGFADPVPFDFKTFNLQTADAGKFISVASGHATGSLGPLTATGALKGNSDRAAFTGNLAIRGSDMIGTLDATLGKRPKLVAKLNVPKTLDVDALLGIEDESAPAPLSPDEAPSEVRHARPARKATPKPINLTAIRSFDASLIVSAKAMSMAALTVDYADLDATLANGVFKINKLTGQFYKGAVDFTGVVDASGQALGVDASGTLLGIHVDELLRGTVGDNGFGTSSRRITVDGKLDARGIRLTGKGASAAELRESLSTATTVSGTVRAGMAGGAQSFAQFATGIGSIFSDTLAFDRAILSDFINHENTVSGGVVLGGGTITLQDQTVQGSGATAVISGQNRMADGTTNTTIGVTTGNHQYVAKVTGKLSSPDISAVSK